MTFEQDYNKLYQFAKDFIINKDIDNIDPSDLLSDCYIYIIETKISYSLKEAKRIITNLGYKEKRKIHTCGIDKIGHVYFKENNRPCKYCSEQKPIDCFPIRYNNPSIRRTMCNDCTNKYNKNIYQRKYKQIITIDTTKEKQKHNITENTKINKNCLLRLGDLYDVMNAYF